MSEPNRTELIAKVREAIAAVGFDPADPDIYGMAEAAVDVALDYLDIDYYTDGEGQFVPVYRD